MWLAKIKPLALSLAVLAVLATPLVMQHRSEAQLRRENETLRRQLDQLAQIQAGKDMLSNQSTQVRQQPPPTDEHRELLRLRGQVGLLLDQSNQVVKLREEVARLRSQMAADSNGPVLPPKTKEVADITYSMPRIPVSQILVIYADLCGKKVLFDRAQGNLSQTLRILTERPVTRTGAMRLIEDALKEQAHLMIVRPDDATLTTVPIPAGQP